MSPTRRRTRLLLLGGVAALAIALAGCSRHTAVTVQVDLVPFLSQSQTQATANYLAGAVDIKLPISTLPANPGALVDVSQLGVPASAFSVIDAFGLTVSAGIDPTTAIGPLTVTLYIADASASNAFQAQYQVKQVQLPSLPGGQTTAVLANFQLDSQNDAAALARIQTGSFRLGVEVQATASSSGTVSVAVSQLLVSASLPPGYGLP